MLAAVQEETPNKAPSESERTCVACRKKGDPKALLRVVYVLPQAEIVLDWRRNLPGRGAHVCASRRCIELAVKERRFDRAFRSQVNYPTADTLVEMAKTAIERKFETLLRSGIGARKVVVGSDASLNALSRGKVSLLLLAEDASSREMFAHKAQQLGLPIRVLPNKQWLGQLTGRQVTGVVSITDTALADSLILTVDRRAALD